MKQETKQIESPLIPLQILSDILAINGVRKYININNFGYSQVEREIAAQLTNWQKEQDKSIIEQLLLSNKLLCDILEVERTQNGISLNIRYGTEYELSKKIYEKALNHIKNN